MSIVILDTECANLYSVKWAIKRLGYTAIISNNPNVISHSKKLFLPGVGTAKSAMKYLFKYNLTNLIQNYKEPVLGICLGMQLLGYKSEENENVVTLGLLKNNTTLMNSSNLPLPHMGWNKVIPSSSLNLFRGIKDGGYFYFAHSYAMTSNKNTIAEFQYGKIFSAAIQKNNFFGVQFHPERSGKIGAKLLKNFLEM